MNSDIKNKTLDEISSYVNERMNVNELNNSTYISTENMLPNKGGITDATTLPNMNLTSAFKMGDVLVSNIRPYFKKIWQATFDGGCSNDVLVFRAKDGTDSKYLYYVLSNDKFFDYSMSTSKGTKMPRGDKKSLMEYSVPDINTETQRKIAKVLSALDDKIELNNSINNNLEQQAQAIYSNFIDNCDTQIIKVSDITATANTGADAIQKAPIVDYDTGVKCIRVGDLSNNRDIYQWGYSKVTDEVFKQYQLKKDDILVTRTATLGLNRLITSDLNAVYNNGLIKLTVDKSKIYPLFLYRQFQTSDFFNFINRIESETSVRPNMKINYLLGYEFECPKIDKQKELIELLIPLMNLIEHNSHQNNRLIQLRDTLLPKLMSGEIDVDKVEV